jgi:hypothetical protein
VRDDLFDRLEKVVKDHGERTPEETAYLHTILKSVLTPEERARFSKESLALRKRERAAKATETTHFNALSEQRDAERRAAAQYRHREDGTGKFVPAPLPLFFKQHSGVPLPIFSND